MQVKNRLGLSLLLAAALGSAAVVACSTGADASAPAQADLSAHEMNDLDLATAALKIMGASQIPKAPGEVGSCSFTGCHSINPVTLKGWNEEYTAAVAFLQSDASNEEKINYFREDPSNPATGFSPERSGPLAAGIQLTLADVDPVQYPETYKQAQLFASIFAGKDDLYAEFREEMRMPVLPQYPTLTAPQYETILTFFQRGTPEVAKLLQEDRPTKCVDDIAALRTRTSLVKTQTWAAKNASNGMPMLGCPAPIPGQPVSATACFQQKKPDGSDLFARAEWGTDGSTTRILRDLKSPNSFWMRSSADGRFIATGGGQSGGAQAVDLQATLDGVSRDIGLRASYDPDFWPDNKAFMFQGGTKFCAQSLLEKPSTTLVSFSEPECSSLSSASGLYQTVGQVVADNSISDRFIVFSDWAGDSGSYSVTAKDTAPRGGEDSAVTVYTAVAKGNDVEDGYKVAGNGFKLKTPYRGDTMMGRSGSIIGSRWAYGADPSTGKTAGGYALEGLERRRVGDHYEFSLQALGNICMKGNKANISFDERFLATHHYNEPSDYPEGSNPAYAQKGSSDILVADFITGKKVNVTKMPPGYFALYAHFRADGWLYFLAVQKETGRYMIGASDWAIRQTEAVPTP